MTEKTRPAKLVRARLEQRARQRIKRRAWGRLRWSTWEDDGGAPHPEDLED